MITAVAAYVATVVFLVDSRPGANKDSASPDRAPAGAPAFPASDYLQSHFPRPGRPLIGVNYIYHGFPECKSLVGTAILGSYHEAGVPQKVHAQLFQMRRAGVATIRTIVFHMTDPSGQTWGPIPSAQGTLQEPYRTNLIRYLSETKRFGFTRLTISFGPAGTNNPRLPTYDPAKLRENWLFIKTVRALVKRYGPSETRIDLMSEGAPSEAPSAYFPVPRQMSRYLQVIYGLYVSQFGNRDVTVSTIAPTHPTDMTNRLGNLVGILRSTGRPLPRWYEVHIPYGPVAASSALRYVDSALNANRQDQPVVIGETAYDSSVVAKSIREFLQSSSRPIEEVSPWFLRKSDGCWVPPPYEPGAYGRELQG